jgi:hydroxypyruvate isomerase
MVRGFRVDPGTERMDTVPHARASETYTVPLQGGDISRGYRLRPSGAETYNRSMPRFAANLSFLFTERPFFERFAAAKAAGFAAVEFHFPYEFDRAALAEVVLTSGLEVVLFNLPPGDWAAGERGIACHPRRIAEFQDGVGRAIEYARLLGCPRLNCLAGIAPGEVSHDKAWETLVENLRFAATR